MLSATRAKSLANHVAVHTSLALLFNLTMPSTTSAQNSASASKYFTPPMLSASLVKMTATSNWSPPSPDPMGAAYIPDSNRLMISDSEVEEMPMFKRVNIYETTLSGTVMNTFVTASFSKEPTGVAYNPSNRHLFISDDDQAKVFEIDPGADGKYFTSDDVRTSFDTKASKSLDAEGITFGNGFLYIADGLNTEIYEVRPGANGRFDGQRPAGDDLFSHFDTGALGILDPETVEFNSTSGTLYITGRGAKQVIETTTSGELLDVIDIAFLNATNPAGMAHAPGSLNPVAMNLYIVTRGVDNDSNGKENDGKMYEISIQYPPAATSISIDDFSINEGDSGTVQATFTLRLSGPNKRNISVDYDTADSTATAGNDYLSNSGTVNFPAGTTCQTITLVVSGDVLYEANETFLVNLSNPTNVSITDGQGLGTILNNDVARTSFISINDVIVIEGDSGTVNAVFKVSLSALSNQTVTVDYATADSTATAGSDYESGSGTPIFPAETTFQTLAVVVKPDGLVEPRETFLVNLSSPTGGSIADGQGLGMIMEEALARIAHEGDRAVVSSHPPLSLQLYQNHPNPFNPSTHIRYSLPADSRVRLAIYDVAGRTIAVLVDGFQGAGIYTHLWSASEVKGWQLHNGVYFYQLQAGAEVVARKMMLVR